MTKTKVAIGNDHAGTELKLRVMAAMDNQFEFINYGTDSEDSVDYPDFVHPVAKDVESGKASFGILICGSGNGVCMTANKYQGVRAGLAWLPEIAALTKQHNNANIICIPARFLSEEAAFEVLQAYLDSEFEGGRHQRRVDKISC
ncbi:MAG: ribose 5-phosphate isomerase B [Bacteroidia bacterium]